MKVKRNVETCVQGDGLKHSYSADVSNDELRLWKLQPILEGIVMPLCDWELIKKLVSTAIQEHSRTVDTLDTLGGEHANV